MCFTKLAILLALFTLSAIVAQCSPLHGVSLPDHVSERPVAVEESASQPSALVGRDEAGLVTIDFVNNLPSDNVHAYIQTNDLATGNIILIQSDGNVYVPTPSSRTKAQKIGPEAKCGIRLGVQGSTTRVRLSTKLVNARITVADGELDLNALQLDSGYSLSITDPQTNIHWGFLEANQAGSDFWINPSYVDFAGLSLPFTLKSSSSGASACIKGFPADGVKRVCDLLWEAESEDGMPWTSLCTRDQNNNLIRVASPMIAPDNIAFAKYWEPYIDDVWKAIASRGISFDLQDNNWQYNVNCTIKDDDMYCGTIGPFVKPCSDDIWKCDGGPFKSSDTDYGHIASRLCAGFHRGTLLLPGGEVQPSLPRESYYPKGQTYNKYAKILHSIEVDGKGYTFPTDDTKAKIHDVDISGLVGMPGASNLTIYAGGLNQAQQDEWSSEATPANKGSMPTLQPLGSPVSTGLLVTSTITLPPLTTVSSVAPPSISILPPSGSPVPPVSGGSPISTGYITGSVQMVDGGQMAIVTEVILIQDIVYKPIATTYVSNSAAAAGST